MGTLIVHIMRKVTVQTILHSYILGLKSELLSESSSTEVNRSIAEKNF